MNKPSLDDFIATVRAQFETRGIVHTLRCVGLSTEQIDAHIRAIARNVAQICVEEEAA